MADESNQSGTTIITPGAIISSQNQALIAINASMMPFKLTNRNYAAWRAQFRNLLFGYDLLGYIDGSLPCPSLMLPSSTSNSVPNPEAKLWQRQDSFILHGMIGSISHNLSSLVSACETSHQAWTKLERTYANKSRTRMLTLCDSLMRIKKDAQTIDEYMQSIKKISDDLALISYPLNDDELVIHVLNGLGTEFKEICAICAAIRARDTPVSFEELHDKLLDQEAYLKREDQDQKLSSPITAQYNQRYNNNKGRNGNNNSPSGYCGTNSNNKKPQGNRSS